MVSFLTLSTEHLTLASWKHKVELEDGIKTMYEWYLSRYEELKCL